MHIATMAAPLRALARMALPSLSSAFFTTASEAFFSSIFSSGSSTMRKDANAARRFWYSATPSAKYFALSLPTQIKSMFCIVIVPLLCVISRLRRGVKFLLSQGLVFFE